MTFLLIFIFVWAGLFVILWAGTLWFQAYIYSEPVPAIYWRAGATAGAVAVLLTFWCYLYSRAAQPGYFDRIFAFSPRNDTEFPRFSSTSQGQTVQFEKRKTAHGPPEFREVPNGTRPWSRSDAVTVEENGTKVEFKADRDEKGNFKKERRTAA